MTKEQFSESMAYLGLAYGKEFTHQELSMYYDFLKGYSDATLTNAIKNIIRKSKFLPKITELLEECDNCKEKTKFEVLEYMNSQGYFKAGSEYDKAIMFLERNNIPEWFKADLNRYYKMMLSNRLEHKETLMIG